MTLFITAVPVPVPSIQLLDRFILPLLRSCEMTNTKDDSADATRIKISKSKCRKTIISFALITRLLMLFVMILSCAILPDFNPGDDVLKFQMRLDNNNNNNNRPTRNYSHDKMNHIHMHDNNYQEDNDESSCFCLQGHACDFPMGQIFQRIISPFLGTDELSYSSHLRFHPNRNSTCSAYYHHDHTVKPNVSKTSSDSIYRLLLTPLTRWDSARFLSLAVDPLSRYPAIITINSTSSSWPNYHSCYEEQQCTASSLVDINNFVDWNSSEQAHAFFPLFPLLIRQVALILLFVSKSFLPTLFNYLPSTFEGLIVLSALLCNLLAFCLAALILFEFTYLLISPTSQHTNNGDHSPTNASKHIDRLHYQAIQASLLSSAMYCLNPATIFFIASYSETIFSFFTFAGYFLSAKCQLVVHTNLVSFFEQRHLPHSKKVQTHTSYISMFMSIIYAMLAVLFWTFSSYTRSNGTLSAMYVFISLCSLISYCARQFIFSPHTHSLSTTQKHDKNIVPFDKNIDEKALRYDGETTAHSLSWWISFITYLVLVTLAHVIAIYFIFFPFRYHDRIGYSIHCTKHDHDVQLKNKFSSTTSLHPPWCFVSTTMNPYESSYFSLYAYVQRVHWNVGLFRYYEWKQIPNFLLATPILCIGIYAAFDWIRTSWWRYAINLANHCNSSQRGISDLTARIRRLYLWTLYALSAIISGDSIDSSNIIMEYSAFSLIQSNMLCHYAILAGFCIIGLTVAHVQISTRMICSSCPALYWYMAHWLIMQFARKERRSRYLMNEYDTNSSSSNYQKRYDFNLNYYSWRNRISGQVVIILLSYLSLFHIVGPILHVNWLPWT